MIEIYDDILKEELAKITPLDRATTALTDGIAARIDAVMKQKGITKSQLAKMTGHRPRLQNGLEETTTSPVEP